MSDYRYNKLILVINFLLLSFSAGAQMTECQLLDNAPLDTNSHKLYLKLPVANFVKNNTSIISLWGFDYCKTDF